MPSADVPRSEPLEEALLEQHTHCRDGSGSADIRPPQGRSVAAGQDRARRAAATESRQRSPPGRLRRRASPAHRRGCSGRSRIAGSGRGCARSRAGSGRRGRRRRSRPARPWRRTGGAGARRRVPSRAARGLFHDSGYSLLGDAGRRHRSRSQRFPRARSSRASARRPTNMPRDRGEAARSTAPRS